MDAAESAVDQPAGAKGPPIASVAVVILALLAAGVYFWLQSSGAAAERASAERLEALGALGVKGPDSLPASVNRSMLESPDDLAAAVDELPRLSHLAGRLPRAETPQPGRRPAP